MVIILKIIVIEPRFLQSKALIYLAQRLHQSIRATYQIYTMLKYCSYRKVFPYGLLSLLLGFDLGTFPEMGKELARQPKSLFSPKKKSTISTSKLTII